MDRLLLGRLRRLLHNIIVSEVHAEWGNVWPLIAEYLNQQWLRGYTPMYIRPEFNAEGKPPYIDIFAVFINSDCMAIPLGIEVKVTTRLDKSQIIDELNLLNNYMARSDERRWELLSWLGTPKCRNGVRDTGWRIYVLMVPSIIVDDATALINSVKGSRVVSTVIPIEDVIEVLGIREALNLLTGNWGNVIPRLQPSVVPPRYKERYSGYNGYNNNHHYKWYT
jgi:hypothetical protein